MNQQLNDLAVAYYQTELASTSSEINEMELEWLQSLGATSNDLNDAWAEYLLLGGFTDKFVWLESLGHTGQLNDQLLEFYAS